MVWLAFLLLASSLPAQVTRQAPASRTLAATSVQTRLSARKSPEALALFSKYSPPGEFVRNRAAWAADLDFSGFSVWNTGNLDNTGGNRGYGTLIARRVVVFANHFHPGPNTMLVFVGRDGQLVWRKLIDTQRIGETDICLGLLDKDAPETVAVYPLLPPEYVPPPPRMLPPPPETKFVPVICLNQSRQALVHDWYETPNTIAHLPPRAGGGEPSAAQMAVGDSGAPIFLLLGKQLVLLGCHHTATSAPSLAALVPKTLEGVMARWEAGKVRRAKWVE